MSNMLFTMWETIKSIFIIIYVYVGLYILLCLPSALVTGLIAGIVVFVYRLKKNKNGQEKRKQ